MVAEPVEDVTDGSVDGAAVGVGGQGRAELKFCFFESAGLEQEIAEVVAGGYELWFELDSASEIAFGFGVVAERAVDFADVVVNDGHAGLDLESGFEGFQSLFVPAQIVEGDTEIAVAVGYWVFLDCLIELFDSFAGPSGGDEGVGVITARLPGVCVAVDGGLPERIDGFVGGGLLPSEDATDDQDDHRDDLNELRFTLVSVLPEVANKSEEREGGHVDPTVCDPGVEHAVNVEKSSEREEHAEKEEDGCGGATPAALEGFPGEE